MKASGLISTSWFDSFKGKDGRAGLVLRCLHLEALTFLQSHLPRPSVLINLHLNSSPSATRLALASDLSSKRLGAAFGA
ncbi:F-box family protein [Prunus dulcis]|uniref:F-box family protein n=1 Tax=Prunus dulcis TaxID=3755 RepID=A0A4Y1QPY3_PRUDU|nr:F-box family protein [Prunus dulcis]